MQFNLNLENINYIKVIYQDSDGSARYVKAALRSLNEREIFACAKFEDGLVIQTPQEVSISFICENGLYRTTTMLKHIENDEPYVFFTLTTPQGIEYQQNREYFRVRMNDNAILKFNNNIFACKMYDISANGVRLILDKDLQIPKFVELDILFADRSVKTKAKYIRTDNEDKIWKASFNFVNISENDVDYISKKCIQMQLSNRRGK